MFTRVLAAVLAPATSRQRPEPTPMMVDVVAALAGGASSAGTSKASSATSDQARQRRADIGVSPSTSPALGPGGGPRPLSQRGHGLSRSAARPTGSAHPALVLLRDAL